jgi:hypothetical protein
MADLDPSYTDQLLGSLHEEVRERVATALVRQA